MVTSVQTRVGAADIRAINDNSNGAVYSNILGIAGNSITASVGLSNTGSGGISWSPFKYGVDVHASLVYARDERGANLIEVNNVITVNAPTNLSYSNKTATTVDLNFTAPTANATGTDAYEVWVDDKTVYRKHFEFSEIAAPGTTLDLTEVFNDLGSITGAKIKIRTIDGQMNFSNFSNEITIV